MAFFFFFFLQPGRLEKGDYEDEVKISQQMRNHHNSDQLKWHFILNLKLFGLNSQPFILFCHRVLCYQVFELWVDTEILEQIIPSTYSLVMYKGILFSLSDNTGL